MQVTKCILIIILVGLTSSCKKAEPAPISAPLPEVFLARFTNDVLIYVEGDFVVLRTQDVPNHKSPYFEKTDSRFESYNGSNSNFTINPNKIIAQNITFSIPLNPTEATTKTSTALGPIGIAINGVVLYNQFAGPNQPLAGEIDSFDQYNGHPQQTGQYHYHVEPVYITSAMSTKESIIGFLLDGFPVYGPVEAGQTLTSAALDEFHGHHGSTFDYPDGIYHYHVTADSPYINGGKFFGTVGTVTQ